MPCLAKPATGLKSSRGLSLSIPNLITLARILLVPVVVWAIASGGCSLRSCCSWRPAISDAVDGFLAKRFGMKTELGAYLDPLADKVLIVSIYVTLGITGVDPALARHPGGVARHHDRRRDHAVVAGRPAGARSSRMPSPRLNTAAQIVVRLPGAGVARLRFDAEPLLTLVMALVAVLTLLSVAFYVAEWVRHMNSAENRD